MANQVLSAAPREPAEGVPARAGIRAHLLWAALVIVVSLPLWANPIRFVFNDDGLFALQIAWHVERDRRSTFNGVTPTNGYSPLWMAFNVLAMGLARASRPQALYVMMAMEVMLLAGAVFCYRALAARLEVARVWPGTAALLSLSVFKLYGMETFLAIALIVALAIQLLRATREDSPSQWCWFGVLGGLLTLARLDDILLPLVALALSAQGRRRWMRLLCAGLPLVLLAGPYLLYNRFNYGYFGPISEAIKNSFPHLRASWAALGPTGVAFGIVGIAGLIASCLGEGHGAARRLLRVMSLAALTQVVCIFLFSRGWGSQQAGYYTLGIVALALSLDFLATVGAGCLHPRSPSLTHKMSAVALALLVAALILRSATRAMGYVVGVARGKIELGRGTAEDCAIKLAAWMDANLPAGSRMLVSDYPGVLAYRSRVAIVPLDGLMNDYQYNDYLVRHGIAQFIAANGIDYYAGDEEQNDERARTFSEGGCIRIEVRAPLYRQPGGSFLIRRSARILDVSKFCASAAEHIPFGAIWRLTPAPGCGP